MEDTEEASQRGVGGWDFDRTGYGREGNIVVAMVAARAHASISDRIFEVASRVLREAASAPITEINGLTVSRELNVAHGLNAFYPFRLLRPHYFGWWLFFFRSSFGDGHC